MFSVGTTIIFSAILLANTGRGAEKRHAYGLIQLARRHLRMTSWFIAGLEGVGTDSAKARALASLQTDVVKLTARIDEARTRLLELHRADQSRSGLEMSS